MLAFGVLFKRPADLDVDGLTTPLEFLATATRARSIGIENHGSLLVQRKGEPSCLSIHNSKSSQQLKSVTRPSGRRIAAPSGSHCLTVRNLCPMLTWRDSLYYLRRGTGFILA